jgi:hypothetical protein
LCCPYRDTVRIKWSNTWKELGTQQELNQSNLRDLLVKGVWFTSVETEVYGVGNEWPDVT